MCISNVKTMNDTICLDITVNKVEKF